MIISGLKYLSYEHNSYSPWLFSFYKDYTWFIDQLFTQNKNGLWFLTQVRAMQKGTDKKKIITKQIAIMNKLFKRMQINQKNSTKIFE